MKQTSKQTEVRVAGFGGQGVIMAGYIIGKAASLFDQRAATMTQAYGPESRGGACNADVVVGETEIGYPKVKTPQVLIALSQDAFNQNVTKAADDAIVIIDEDLVKPEVEDQRLCRVPATRLAEELGKKVVANIIMLGYFTARTGIVTPEGMRKAIQSSVPARFTALNLRAFDIGYQHGQNN